MIGIMNLFLPVDLLRCTLVISYCCRFVVVVVVDDDDCDDDDTCIYFKQPTNLTCTLLTLTLLHFCHVFRRALRHMYIVVVTNYFKLLSLAIATLF